MALFVTNTLGNICTEALALLNVVSDENSVSADDMNRAAKQLHLMLQSWTAEGATIWRRREVDITTVAGSADLSTNSILTSQIVAVTLLESGDTVGTQLTPMSRDEYRELSDRTLEGRPVYYFPQFTENDEDITVWPIPDASYTLKVDYRLDFSDLDERTDVIEAPKYMLEAIVWNLADRLVVPHGKAGTATAKKVEMKALELYQTAMAFEVIRDGAGEHKFVVGRR